MRIHHDKHHAAYVNNLNAALEGDADLLALSINALLADLSRVPEAKRTAVRNNGGGHANHTLFWEIMAPGGASVPEGALATAIDATFGSFDAFKEQFAKAGATRFGSGWAWLSVGADGILRIESTANQDSPVMEGRTPILGCDVWEHAYYLKYQNRRPDYMAAWWNVVNWTEVARRFAVATA
jgi:Fe-Mn family superoxide dismutase